MNFYQDKDTLIIIGGYAFSASANNHITFPNLTTIQVDSLIQAIINGNSNIAPYFKQIADNNFEVCGGQLGKIGNTYLLVGEHRFDGRYNPNNGPSFTQIYTNQIKKFQIQNNPNLTITNYQTLNDAVHLHRREFNLLPQIFQNGEMGYLISSGVFQYNVDLPYLYPIEVYENNIVPITHFNQYLSNYHSAKTSLHDSLNRSMYMIFYGGMSQYFYRNDSLIQDNLVPLVKTVSLLSRDSNGNYTEYLMPIEMPQLKGSSAEFIYNHQIPLYEPEIIKLNELTQDNLKFN